MYHSLAEATGLTRKQIGSVFDELTHLIQRAVSKKGPITLSPIGARI
jgi:hypothetical protein